MARPTTFPPRLETLEDRLTPSSPKAGIMPVQSSAHGATSGEWSAAWVQYALSGDQAPVLDPTGAVVGSQTGKVRFLTGTFGGEAERAITVPTGTFLYFPVVNS